MVEAQPDVDLLDFLLATDARPKRLLDIGSGSGVLALAGLTLGVAQALGVDPDPAALAAARHNARLNGLSRRLELTDKPLDQLDGAYPLVVANLTGPLLQSLGPKIIDLLSPGGRLIVSGLLIEELPTVRSAFAPPLAIVGQKTQGEWVGLVLDRGGGD